MHMSLPSKSLTVSSEAATVEAVVLDLSAFLTPPLLFFDRLLVVVVFLVIILLLALGMQSWRNGLTLFTFCVACGETFVHSAFCVCERVDDTDDEVEALRLTSET